MPVSQKGGGVSHIERKTGENARNAYFRIEYKTYFGML